MSEEGATGNLKGRILGAVLMLMGVIIVGLSFAMHASGWVVAAVPFGPLCFFLGLAMVIEGPQIPVKKMSSLATGMTAVGTLIGFVLLFGMMFF